MTTELKPLGNACVLQCVYCYQEPMRLAGNTLQTNKYDLDLMFEIADQHGGQYVLFGGEGLLVPKKDLKRIFETSYKKYGGSTVQTSGVLIDDEHIEMFKKYNVHVGVSIDGFDELNDLRVSKSSKFTTREGTKRTIENLEKMVKAGVQVGVITTLHKLNGTKEKLPKLIEFIKWLKSIGINGGNLHMLEVDNDIVKALYLLSEEENTYAFLTLADFFENNEGYNWEPFTDFPKMLRGKDARGCIWKSCDPLNTQSVYGVEGDGSISNCGMVNKEGVEWFKADDTHYMRDFVLYNTPDEYGGCQGCPYFMMCNGYCDGSAIDGDWRNKTIHCKTLKTMFKYYEKKLEAVQILPLSKDPRRKQMEQYFLSCLEKGFRPSLEQVVQWANTHIKK